MLAPQHHVARENTVYRARHRAQFAPLVLPALLPFFHQLPARKGSTQTAARARQRAWIALQEKLAQIQRMYLPGSNEFSIMLNIQKYPLRDESLLRRFVSPFRGCVIAD